VPETNLLWRDLHVRDVSRKNGIQETRNVCVEVLVEGITATVPWTFGLEFDYANAESLYCRPLHAKVDDAERRMAVPDGARGVRVAYLPPMSGLASNETRLDPGAVQVRLGEGRTADVLRNLCWRAHGGDVERPASAWTDLCDRMRTLFGVELDPPRYVAERGEIAMTYRERGKRFDLSAAGRGAQQTLLLLAYLLANPGAVVLLDEPDAHLEILRQRQVYRVIAEMAEASGSQIIAASHSEVLLNEAAGRDLVVAFVGKPHRIDGRASQVLKALDRIGFDHYLQAEDRGWVLYLEGATDLEILRTFARKLDHPAFEALETAFVHYVGNQPRMAQEHFHGLREAMPALLGMGLFDRLDLPDSSDALRLHAWRRREIENYIATPEVLAVFASTLGGQGAQGPLFEADRAQAFADVMDQCVKDHAPPAALRDRADRWWKDVKASDDFLDRVLDAFYTRVGLAGLLRKTNYHVLARHVRAEHLDAEVKEKLDAIEATARAAATARGKAE